MGRGIATQRKSPSPGPNSPKSQHPQISGDRRYNAHLPAPSVCEVTAKAHPAAIGRLPWDPKPHGVDHHGCRGHPGGARTGLPTPICLPPPPPSHPHPRWSPASGRRSRASDLGGTGAPRRAGAGSLAATGVHSPERPLAPSGASCGCWGSGGGH